MNLDKRVIDSGYAIAAFKSSDDMYAIRDDPCIYYHRQHGWGKYEEAEIVNNELLLARLNEACADDSTTMAMGYEIFPIFMEVTISTVDSTAFRAYSLQIKRQRALNKLNDDDLIALGLMGDAS